MLRFLGRRLAALLGIVIGMVALVFFMTRALPGSPVELMLGGKPTAEQIERARKELGLDRPLPMQFVDFALRLAQGDLGRSLRTGQPVAQDIGRRLAASAELVTLSLFVAVVSGVPLGIWAAARRGRSFDLGVRGASVALVAIPVFFLGILLQMLFYGLLGWLPLQGRIDASLAEVPVRSGLLLIDALVAGDAAALRSAAEHLVLPVATLAAATVAIVIRVTRNLMVEVLATDYVRTARAYGLPATAIYFRFALKAVLVPLLTVIGLTYGFMLGGSVIVETLFDWPGIGSYIVDSVVNNDYPAVVGVTVVVASLYLVLNLAVDLLYFAFDPRLSQ